MSYKIPVLVKANGKRWSVCLDAPGGSILCGTFVVEGKAEMVARQIRSSLNDVMIGLTAELRSEIEDAKKTIAHNEDREAWRVSDLQNDLCLAKKETERYQGAVIDAKRAMDDMPAGHEFNGFTNLLSCYLGLVLDEDKQ